MDPRARQAWWWALGLLLPSAFQVVDLFAERIPPGSVHHALEYLGLIDVFFQLTAPFTLAFAAYVLIRYRRIGVGRWLILSGFWVLRLWTVRNAVSSLVDAARMHG